MESIQKSPPLCLCFLPAGSVFLVSPLGLWVHFSPQPLLVPTFNHLAFRLQRSQEELSDSTLELSLEGQKFQLWVALWIMNRRTWSKAAATAVCFEQCVLRVKGSRAVSSGLRSPVPVFSASLPKWHRFKQRSVELDVYPLGSRLIQNATSLRVLMSTESHTLHPYWVKSTAQGFQLILSDLLPNWVSSSLSIFFLCEMEPVVLFS